MSTDKLLSRKVGLVTGGASGLGRAAALAIANEGGSVAVTDIDAAGAQETANLIEQAGGSALAVAGDVSDCLSMEKVVAAAISRFGRLDCAVNNAAIEGDPGTILECEPANWGRVIDVNLTGVWNALRAELAVMVQTGGSVVNVASVVALRGRAGMAPYVAAKHGLIGLTRTAAIEYADQGVRVNAICPGSFATPMTDRVIGTDHDVLVRETPLGRVASAGEVAESLVWLCSDRSGFVTGAVLSVDGGKSAT